MNVSSWQHPFVNIFKHFDIGSTKKCAKQGDVTALMDRELKSTIFRIRGLVPANNYIQFPAHLSNQSLGLTGRLFYLLFRPIFDKFFSIHIDLLTREQHVVRISLSNMYHDLKVTQTSIQLPFATASAANDIHWSILCLDLESILLTHMTNQHYQLMKSIQLCGNMLVKNCFSSQYLYEPSSNHGKTKQVRSLPRDLAFPVNKDESWHDKYDFIMIPNPSIDESSTETYGDVRLQTPRECPTIDDGTTLTSRSLTDVSQNNTYRSLSSRDTQVGRSCACISSSG